MSRTRSRSAWCAVAMGLLVGSVETWGLSPSAGLPAERTDEERGGATILRQGSGREAAVVDPTGDFREWYLLTAVDNSALRFQGKTAVVTAPVELLFGAQALQWKGWTYPGAGDEVPPGGLGVVMNWVSTASSSTTDPVDPALRPTADLLALTFGKVANGKIPFTFKTRGALPGADSLGLISEHYIGGNLYGAIEVRLRPTGSYWLLSGGFVGATPLPYVSTAVNDIVNASVTNSGATALKLRIKTAAALPAVPPANVGNPWYLWQFDTTGDGVVDAIVTVRFDRVTNSWGAVLRKRGTDGLFADVKTLPFTRAGGVITATVKRSDLGVAGTFRWYSQASSFVTLGAQTFSDTFDTAPNTGFVLQN